MSNTLGKNINLCFSLIKRPQHQITNSSKHNLNSQHHHHHHHQNSPLDPPNTAFTKNYNSLFEDITSLTLTTTTTISTYTSPSSVSDTETDYDPVEELGPATPDLTAAYASRRFFISSPGRSNSIVDSLSLSSPEEESDHPSAVAGGVAVETYSPDPYVDFRRSMQEMMEAREVARGVARGDIKEAWQYLQELLLSYLSLNPKSTHKYIVRAFADVVVSSMSPINNIGVTSPSSSPSFSSYCGVTNCSHNNSAYVEIFNSAT